MSILVKHVRDAFRRPFATLVATGRDRVGLAICHSKNDQFKKKEGVLRAKERAELEQNTPPTLPDQNIMVYNDGELDIVHIDEVLTKEYIHMVMRSRKYFV